MLAEHFDDAAVGRQFAAVLVFGEILGNPEFLGSLVDCMQLVGSSFVGSEHTEVGHVQFHDISQERAQCSDVFGLGATGPVNLDGIVGKGRQTQSLSRIPPLRVRIGAHPSLTHRRKFLQFRDQLAALIEKFLGLLRAHPLLENRSCSGFFLTSVSGT